MWRKESYKILLIQLVETAKLYIPFVLLHTALAGKFHGWGATAWGGFFWIVTIERLHALGYEWVTTRFQFDEATLRVRTGSVTRIHTALEWRDVASVTLSQSALERPLKCATISIGIGSERKSQVTLRTIDLPIARTLLRYYDDAQVNVNNSGNSCVDRSAATEDQRAATQFQPEVQRMRTLSSPGALIYQLKGREHVLIALAYGQFLLIVPFAFSMLSELQNWVTIPSNITASLAHVDRWVLLTAGIPLVAGLALCYGLVITWLKFHRFTVRVHDGELVVSGGALSTGVRQIATAHLTGVRLSQNPLMRASGYARLSVVSRDSTGRTQFATLLPLARRDQIEVLVAHYFPRFAVDGSAVVRPPVSYRNMLYAAATSSLLLTTAATALLLERGRVLGASAVVLANLVAVNRAWTAFDPRLMTPYLRYKRGLVLTDEYRIERESLHYMTCVSGPLGRRFGLIRLVATVYAGRTLRLRGYVHVGEGFRLAGWSEGGP